MLSLSVAKVCGEPYVAVESGYRWDRLSNRATLSGGSVGVRGSTQILKNINSFQLGGRGQWNFFPPAACSDFFDNCCFIRGIGHYGWVLGGDYREGNFSGRDKGHTWDVKAAVGCYFCVTPYVWLAPVVGWSYDALILRGQHIKTAIQGKVHHLRDIKANQQFRGPFIGFDLAHEIYPCLHYTFGYELHFAEWHGQRSIEGRNYGNPIYGATTGFSNKRSMSSVYGNVFKLDLNTFYDCWEIGLGLQYQIYVGNQGKFKQTRGRPLSLFTFARVDGLWWRSFGATLLVGRTF